MSFIADLFGGSSPPPLVLPDAPAAPTVDSAAAAQDASRAQARRRGRAATILTGSKGAGSAQTAAKTLLGG